MKIGIQTWGSEGDVRPFLALAAGLGAAGHDATLAVTHVANKDFAEAGEQYGVPVRQVGILPGGRLKHAAEAVARAGGLLKQVGIIHRDLFAPAVAAMLAEAKRLCRENDLVIGHFLIYPLGIAAALARRPHVSVLLAPLLPSSSFPPPGTPHLGRLLNRLLWSAGGALLDRMFLPAVNSLRREEGLAPAKSALHDAFLSSRLNLVASSPALFPRPRDWDDTIQLCGALRLPGQHDDSALPQTLRQFLDAGPPPVYMTIGSMSLADPVFPDTVQLLSSAARMAKCRAIVQTEGATTGCDDTHPDIFPLDQAEHELLFPRCAAVVHHGGAGTTHATLRAGVPSIVIEHVTDQAFWGGVLHRRGCAPRLLHRRTVTALQLARAIRTALGSEEMRDRAFRIGERMRGEDGVLTAVGLIEGLLPI